MKGWKTAQSIIFLALAIGLLHVATVHAIDATSSSYFLRGSLQQGSGLSTSTSFTQRNGPDIPGAGSATSADFGVRAGFLNFLFGPVQPLYAQTHFHWKNDDGTESSSTSATGGMQDTALSNVATGTIKRLRVEIANLGGTKFSYSPISLRLQIAFTTTTCSGATFSDVATSGAAWVMASTSLLTEASNTTNIAAANGGVSDSNAFFMGAGGQRKSTNQIGATSISSQNFYEAEFAVKPTATASSSGTYCFRLTNAGSASLFRYDSYASATVAPPPFVNAIPQISAVVVNNGSNITLTTNATKTITVSFQISDNDGCSDVFASGTVTSTLFRSGISPTSSSPDYRNLYQVGTSSIVNSCSGSNTTANATATFQLWYFADATDASSSFPSDTWKAYIQAKDGSASTTATTSVGGVELNTLVGMRTATNSISYGQVSIGGDTGATNQELEAYNVGNASFTRSIYGNALHKGSVFLATSSQHFASGTFTFGGGEQQLSGTSFSIAGSITPVAPGMRPNWSSATPLPYALQLHSSLACNGYLYNLGGLDTTGTVATATVLYAPIYSSGTIGSWLQANSLPQDSYSHTSACSKGYIYNIGGNNTLGSNTSSVFYAQINSNGTIGNWSSTSPLPMPLLGNTSFIKDSYIYSLGGLNSSNVLYAPIYSSGTIGSWQYATPFSYAINLHASFYYGNYAYVLGGFFDANDTSTVLYAPIYSSGTIGSWSQTTALPYNLRGHSAFAYGGIAYVLGGYAYNSAPTSTVLYAPINSDGTLGDWRVLQNLPYPDDTQTAVAYNGFVYNIAGWTGSAATSTVLKIAIPGKTTFWGSGIPGNAEPGVYTSTITYVISWSP